MTFQPCRSATIKLLPYGARLFNALSFQFGSQVREVSGLLSFQISPGEQAHQGIAYGDLFGKFDHGACFLRSKYADPMPSEVFVFQIEFP